MTDNPATTTHAEIVATGLHECASDCPTTIPQPDVTALLTDAEKLRVLAAWFDMWDETRYEDRQRLLDDEQNPGKNDVQSDLRRIADRLAALPAAQPAADLRAALEQFVQFTAATSCPMNCGTRCSRPAPTSGPAAREEE